MLFGNRILVGYIIIQLVCSHAPAWFGLFLLLVNDRMLLQCVVCRCIKAKKQKNHSSF